jgi:hypothetical protein
MDQSLTAEATLWPLWKKILFRFMFVLLTIFMAPWTWLPGTDFITKYYFQLLDWVVDVSNAHLFHVRKVLVPMNGSGDTSYGWAMLWLFLSISIVVTIVWSVADRSRPNYTHFNYWLCLFSRYFICFVAFGYGFIKLFAMQMPFPNLHQLATPLGDFLPMRLSWMFIGYSAPYQAFSGIMEIVAASLLLFRRTTTLGVMVAAAVFLNVVMLNLCYDIPVKMFSIQLEVICLYLLANESERIICFFILNKPAATCSIYHYEYPKRWMRITRIVLKVVFVFCFIAMPLWTDSMSYYFPEKPKDKTVIKDGVYDVVTYKVNNQQAAITDTLRWQDFIIDKGNGSIYTADTAFTHKYNRGYFGYKFDTVKHTVAFTKKDKSVILTMNYLLPDTSTIKLSGKRGNDSLFVELKRSKRHFQLTERQFHWLTEYNR